MRDSWADTSYRYMYFSKVVQILRDVVSRIPGIREEIGAFDASITYMLEEKSYA